MLASYGSSDSGSGTPAQKKKVILFVWDGLRPDSIDPTNTPNLYGLAQKGVFFSDNHSTYPTFTMMNAGSLATGDFPYKTGFYGNTIWRPGASGTNSAGQTVDFNQPVYTEDYKVLQDLNNYYNNQLLLVSTTLQAAQKAGLKTAVVGKSGAAFLFDYKKGGIILDERMAYPLSFAQELQNAGYPLPKYTPFAYDNGSITLSQNNGDPTGSLPVKRLNDGVTSDPTDMSGSPYCNANTYMMNVYLNYILPNKNPDVSVIWFRDPDSTQHVYGLGVYNYKLALKCMDSLLGQLLDTLKQKGLDKTTDIIIVSDHGHNTVSGDLSLFPLRKIINGQVDISSNGIDNVNGYSVSGDVRLADLLTRAGFSHVYDGRGCVYDPVLSGIKADGTPVYPTKTDTDGSICGKAGKKYTTASFKVPENLPRDAIVIAPNGGSEYLYVPSKDSNIIKQVVSYLQSREEFGAIFVDDKYGPISGTFPLSLVKLENTAGRNPDIIVSYNYDENAVVQGMKGIEYESFNLRRGMHGSFSPFDVHNTLIAYGPDFKSGSIDNLPTGNVDVAPTIAYILGLSLPNTDGRILAEAILNPPGGTIPSSVISKCINSDKVSNLKFMLPTDPDGKNIDNLQGIYYVKICTKTLSYQGNTYTYFDYAKGVRQ
jgi:predicted AlkP superfamily pyrophosphatase or phosphodiesterase